MNETSYFTRGVKQQRPKWAIILNLLVAGIFLYLSKCSSVANSRYIPIRVLSSIFYLKFEPLKQLFQYSYELLSFSKIQSQQLLVHQEKWSFLPGAAVVEQALALAGTLHEPSQHLTWLYCCRHLPSPPQLDQYLVWKMVSISCFCVRREKKKQTKGGGRLSEYRGGPRTIPVNFQDSSKPFKTVETSMGNYVPINSKTKCKVKVMNHENTSGRSDALEAAYEGGDEHEEFSLEANPQTEAGRILKNNREFNKSPPTEFRECSQPATKAREESETAMEHIKSGHFSDPGIEKAELWPTPKLKRSCSNLETRNVLKKIGKGLPSSTSHSYEDLQDIAEGTRMNYRDPGSPVLSHHSADRVMLKKHSSSQILPSGSRKIWWKLFLWSHRNSHNFRTSFKPEKSLLQNTAWNQQGGYCSDTLEPGRSKGISKMTSPRSFTADSLRGGNDTKDASKNLNWKGFHGRDSGLWPPNQWVAFSTESTSLDRVDEWVRDLEYHPLEEDEEGNVNKTITLPLSAENGKSSAHRSAELRLQSNPSKEMLHANSIIQSLNASSTAAHVAGIGLKVIPAMYPYSSLRTVNLSNNLIAHITPGSLPKGLHTLDLSRNKITTVEGLKDLTRLRVLDLSYNRIARIDHGLSNCQLIKELYLAGNTISYVEGLHRLEKLAVLDISFNKITTTRAMGQLVANYNSLLALNLLGNPIQKNISEEQIRKSVCGLLPKLAYLNKQAIKSHRVRQVVNDNVARAALGGSNSRSSRRRTEKRVCPGGLLTSNRHRSKEQAPQGSRHNLRNRSHSHHPSPLHRSSTFASSTR